MGETFADSPTKAVESTPIRDLWKVTVQFHVEPESRIEAPEVLTVQYTVKVENAAPASGSWKVACRKAHEDVMATHDGDMVTILQISAELLPPVIG